MGVRTLIVIVVILAILGVAGWLVFSNTAGSTNGGRTPVPAGAP
jgi:predicted negative regulator of RcsB-dependent stress response